MNAAIPNKPKIAAFVDEFLMSSATVGPTFVEEMMCVTFASLFLKSAIFKPPPSTEALIPSNNF